MKPTGKFFDIPLVNVRVRRFRKKTEPDSKNFKFSNRNRELKNNRTRIGTEKLFDDN